MFAIAKVLTIRLRGTYSFGYNTALAWWPYMWDSGMSAGWLGDERFCQIK